MGILQDIAGTAVGILLDGFRRSANHAAERTVNSLTDAAINKLLETIRRRLGSRPSGTRTLEHLRRHPDDPAARRELRKQLESLLAEDPTFLAELAGDVANYTNALSVDAHITVEAGGRIDLSNSFNPTVGSRVEQNIHIFPPPASRPEPPPSQLEPPPVDFVGRSAQLRDALGMLRRRESGTPVVLVSGQPGVGKSAFAHVLGAHLRTTEYPDAQLEVHLSGEGQPPKSAEDALRELLLDLHVPVEEISPDLDSRRAQYRAELQHRRALVVLDGAVGLDQVRFLLPPSGCAAVVTSQVDLHELVALGARLVRLEPLTMAQSLWFLATRVGKRRVAGELPSAMAIVNACGRLPLALTLVAANLQIASGKYLPLRVMASRLEDPRFRLGQLVVGSLNVAAALATSYEALNDEERHVLHIMGLLDVPEVDAAVMAAAAELPDELVTARLGRLADGNLIAVTGSPGDRWRMHDLVRLFAREMAVRHLSFEEQQAAVARAVDEYLTRARSWREVLRSEAVKINPALGEYARAQLELERRNLVAIVHRAVGMQVALAHGLLAELLDLIFEAITVWPEAPRALEATLVAAKQRQDLDLQARALYAIARDHAVHGDAHGARRLLGEALSVANRAGDAGLVNAIAHALASLDDRSPWPRPGWNGSASPPGQVPSPGPDRVPSPGPDNRVPSPEADDQGVSRGPGQPAPSAGPEQWVAPAQAGPSAPQSAAASFARGVWAEPSNPLSPAPSQGQGPDSSGGWPPGGPHGPDPDPSGPPPAGEEPKFPPGDGSSGPDPSGPAGAGSGGGREARGHRRAPGPGPAGTAAGGASGPSRVRQGTASGRGTDRTMPGPLTFGHR